MVDEATINTIIELRRENQTYESIGDKLNLNKHYVKKLYLTNKDGSHSKEIAEILGIPESLTIHYSLERAKQIKKMSDLWQYGWAASRIANEMDISRSAVCALASRLRHLFPEKRKVRSANANKEESPEPVVEEWNNPEISTPPKDLRLLSMDEIKSTQCRWVVSEKPVVYCGCDGFPWCTYHRRIVYRPR